MKKKKLKLRNEVKDVIILLSLTITAILCITVLNDQGSKTYSKCVNTGQSPKICEEIKK